MTPTDPVTQSFIQNFEEGNLNHEAQRLLAQYRTAFANWLEKSQSQITPDPEPEPPMITYLADPELAAHIFIAWSNSVFTDPGVKLDLSPALKQSQAERLVKSSPAQPPKVPSVPMGPNDGSGWRWAYASDGHADGDIVTDPKDGSTWKKVAKPGLMGLLETGWQRVTGA